MFFHRLFCACHHPDHYKVHLQDQYTNRHPALCRAHRLDQYKAHLRDRCITRLQGQCTFPHLVLCTILHLVPCMPHRPVQYTYRHPVQYTGLRSDRNIDLVTKCYCRLRMYCLTRPE